MRDLSPLLIILMTGITKSKSPELLSLVEKGFAVLTASGTVLRRGYTTGTTAAAACKAAILSMSGVITSVPVHLPCGLTADVEVTGVVRSCIL